MEASSPGLISISAGTRGRMRSAAAFSLNGWDEMPWNEVLQSMSRSTEGAGMGAA